MSVKNKYRYDIGDRVRIWAIVENPVGTIMRIEEDPVLPVKFEVNYIYRDGTQYTECFTIEQLGLSEKSSGYIQRCTCGLKFTSSGGKHSDWCGLPGQHEEGKTHGS
jgi:hypothetical protein